jgi:hypothetical protein
MKMLYDMDFWKNFPIKGKLWKLNVFFDTMVAVVLVGNLENVCVFGAMPMIVGAVMVLVAAMMNGNFQTRRIDQKHRQGQQGDYCFYRSFHQLKFNGAKLRKKLLSFSNIPKISRTFAFQFFRNEETCSHIVLLPYSFNGLQPAFYRFCHCGCQCLSG